MSTPTQVLPTEIRAEIAGFVAAVEHELDDLPRDDAAELTGGLEADLIEAWAAEGTTPTQRFGTPQAYAADLRSAAGLPPKGRSWRGLPHRRSWADLGARVTALPGGSTALGLATTLRPVWWVARGYAAYLLFAEVATRAGAEGHLAPRSWSMWAAFLVPVLLSVEIGRRSLEPAEHETARRRVLVTGNVVALAALAVLGSTGSASSTNYVYVGESDPQTTGLYNDGYKVVNVFPYDADGRLLSGVQLFDDRGKPVQIGSDGRAFVDRDTAHYDLVPAIGRDGQQRWNVFPMQVIRTQEPDGTKPDKPQPQDAAKPDPSQEPLLVTSGGQTVNGTGETK